MKKKINTFLIIALFSCSSVFGMYSYNYGNWQTKIENSNEKYFRRNYEFNYRKWYKEQLKSYQNQNQIINGHAQIVFNIT